MELEKRNHLETSPNTSFIEYDAQFTESIKALSTVTPSNAEIKEPIQYFYLRLYLILIISFSNSLITIGLNSNSRSFLIASISILVLLLILSMFTILHEENHCFSSVSFIFKRGSLLIITSIVLVLIDPNTVFQFLYTEVDSALSSLQTLLLITSLFYRYQTNTLKVLVFLAGVSAISFALNMKSRSYSLRITFEFILLFSYLISAYVYTYTRAGSLQRKNLNLNSGTGVEDITLSLNKVLMKMQKISENDENFDLSSVILELQNVNQALRQTPNIYSAQMNSVLKDMDDDDKIFIEQACFESCHSSKRSSNHDIPIAKQREAICCTPDLMSYLKNIGKDWNFNTFFISNCTSGYPLQAIGSYTIRKFGLDDQLSIPDSQLSSFLQELEHKYLKNPYHNSTHGADVMCSTIYLLSASPLIDNITNLELLSSILASLAHDVGHPGKNNRFLVMSQSNVAVIYNDISVLEMMHASILFEIFREPGCNVLSGLSNEKWMIVRKDIIDMILATDMGKHFELLGLFKAKYMSSDFHDFYNQETRADLFRLIIKAADIGHAAKSIELHQKWCELVIQEFYEQGDLEKQLNLPVSMYCDRETTEISKSQSGFLKSIVLPLFSTINIVLLSQQIEVSCIKQIQSNQQFWESYRSTERSQNTFELDAKKNFNSKSQN